MSSDSPLISARHQELYRKHYSERNIYARRPNMWLNRIENIARHVDARTIIDYGCGQARGISSFSALPVYDYDPGVLGCERIPEPADLVVSIHMLEHVEPARVDAVITHMRSLALKAALIVVSCEHSTKMLSDGVPWHTFVRDYAWWANRLGGTLQDSYMQPGQEYATLLTS